MAKKTRKITVTEEDIHRLEFHRDAVALLPDTADRRPGVALMLTGEESSLSYRSCNCSRDAPRTCKHVLKLSKVYSFYLARLGTESLLSRFNASIWHGIAEVLADGSYETPRTVQIQEDDFGDESVVGVADSRGEEILAYIAPKEKCRRFIERCSIGDDDKSPTHRSTVLERLAQLALTENEHQILARGYRTRGMAMRESFWYRMAYHIFREFDREDYAISSGIDDANGAFVINCACADENVRVVVPPTKVKRVLAELEEPSAHYSGMAIHPIPLREFYRLTLNDALDLEIHPLIRLTLEDGSEEFYERKDLESSFFGDLVSIGKRGLIGRLEPSGEPLPDEVTKGESISKAQVPAFLAKLGGDLHRDPYIVDEGVRSLRIYGHFDRVEIAPEAIERDWYWLSVEYGFGDTAISLRRILQAREEGERFIETDDGWVDTMSTDLDGVASLQSLSLTEAGERRGDILKLSPMDLLRIRALSGRSPDIITADAGSDKTALLLQNLLEMKPASPLPDISGMTTELRSYQKLGVEWIWFLSENRFGGLLCDDMGLGKTHQVMAFMLCLDAQAMQKHPFLVVCPTTVLSHWENKIRDHAPSLRATVYHGVERNLEEAAAENNVLLTSYGILRRDIDKLKTMRFSLAVFDEIQYVKNADTQTYTAAAGLDASMKLGLTGTPIENTLYELKALMDLTVPGLIGTGLEFASRYVEPIERDIASPRRKELSALISPFVLRRLKRTVLKELPAKIEDIRTCSLSEDQVALYREAISLKGKDILQVLEEGEEPVPYIHVFALLMLLKQICNHPALVEKRVEDYERYESGKWDLFRELLSQSLDSGQKVVVYSQFLGMIDIIAKYLEDQEIGFCVLTGASRKRGEIIARFNDDPDCRVFVGSLKAGGIGIDLVASSVVIHYDRWWNAAKEDQATDRVHRIGQKRGVQVFKLVTEGTLEEKISAIIEKKRNLMDSVVREDDPGLLKAFTKQELIDMLSDPVSY